MTQLIERLLTSPADNDHTNRQATDVVVFVSTTCLCALGALMLPLVG